MDSLGNIIRTARLQTGLSLEQVSARTRIPVGHLQAIENDHVLYFPSAFFYKSFVRQFAGEVSVSYDSLIPLLEITLADVPEPAVPGQGEVIIEKAVLMPMRRAKRLRWLRPAGALVATLMVCSGIYTYWESAKATLQSAILSQAKTEKLVVPNKTDSKPVESDNGFQVEISGIERSWLAIVADGHQIFNGYLEVDQTKVLKGHEMGRIRTGNAGGVSLVFNGKPIGVAGPRGQIRTVVFTKDNYQVLQPSTHAALTNHSVSFVQVLHLSRLGEPSFLPFQSY